MDEENKFKAVKIDIIDYEQHLPCDLFIKLGTKFVKFCNSGDVANMERMKKIQAKGIKELYIEEDQTTAWDMYLAVKEQHAKEAQDGRMSEYTKKAVIKCRKAASEKIEKLYSFKMPEQALSASAEITASIMNDMETKPSFVNNFLLTYKDDFNLFEHAYNVATIALSLGKLLQMDKDQLRNLGMGAILHDVGKREFKFNYNKPVDQFTKEEEDEYKRHPAYGAQFLRRGKDLAEDVYVIVFQHHERINGEGFPQGLTKVSFNSLAQIVALANHLDHFLSSNIITNHEKAQDVAKQTLLEFLGKHELDLIKKVSGIVMEIAESKKGHKTSADQPKDTASGESEKDLSEAVPGIKLNEE